jgi:hypothetical protein
VFSRLTVLFAVGLLLTSLPQRGQAAPILSSAVSYDSGSRLYTYSYTIDYRNHAPSAVTGLDFVQIFSFPSAPFLANSYPEFPAPISTSSPAGWNFHFLRGYFSGQIPGAPPLIGPPPSFGVFEWRTTGPGVLPGTTLNGFQLTTPWAPNELPLAPANTFHTEGAVEIGLSTNDVLAPRGPSSPEPGTLALCLSGCLAVGGGALWRGRSRSATLLTPTTVE